MSRSTPGTRLRRDMLSSLRGANETLRVAVGRLLHLGTIYDTSTERHFRTRRDDEYPENDPAQLNRIIHECETARAYLAGTIALAKERLAEIERHPR